MLLPRMGASHSAKHICLFLSVVSTLVMSVSAAPGDALNMMPNTSTTCASATGAWTVGLNQTTRLLTFVNSNGYEFSVNNRNFTGFTGGNCLEPNSSVLYFISDYATGNLTLKNGAYSWTDDFLPGTGGKNGNPIIQRDFTKAATTIGTDGHAVNCVAVTDKSITLWNPGAQAYTSAVNLAE